MEQHFVRMALWEANKRAGHIYRYFTCRIYDRTFVIELSDNLIEWVTFEIPMIMGGRQ